MMSGRFCCPEYRTTTSTRSTPSDPPVMIPCGASDPTNSTVPADAMPLEVKKNGFVSGAVVFEREKLNVATDSWDAGYGTERREKFELTCDEKLLHRVMLPSLAAGPSRDAT